ncbi:MAG: hypothetical protein A2051_07440 [Desulfovibrionales bacterium GWA2_65_9]|nr:MAG: hypothetical protein A2051_07440 [Desulfovibrionales bacterium GWA2_65_9]
MSKHWKRLLLFGGLTAFFGFYFARKLGEVDLATVWATIASSRIEGLALFFVAFLCTSLVHARRMGLLLESFKSIPFLFFFHVDNISSLISYALPGAGEVFRFLYLKNTHGIPFLVNFSVLALERLLFVAVAALSLVWLPISGLGGNHDRVVMAASIVAGALGLTVVVVNARRDVLRRLLTWLLTRIRLLRVLGAERMNDLVGMVEHCLLPSVLSRSLLLTVVQCIFLGLRHYAIYLAFGYDINMASCIAAYVAVFLIMVVPSTPGRIGVFEAACLSLFNGVLGVPVNVVLAAILLDRVLNIVALAGQTAYSLWRLDLSLLEIVRMRREPDPLRQAE